MKNRQKLKSFTAIFIFVFLSAACNGGSQIEEANKLVAEAGKDISEANELARRTEKKNKELFDVNIRTNEELLEYKRKMNAEAKTIIDDFAKVSDLIADSARKFADASRLNVPEEFKEYLETKAEEFSKRAEAVNIRKGNAQAFLDYDDATMVKKFEENNEQSEQLLEEAKELGEKADRIEQENKEIFLFLRK